MKLAIAAVALTVAAGAYAGDAPDGKAIFASKCASCHAKDGKGNASMAKMFKVDASALDLTGKDAKDKKDGELTDLISNGKNKMPKFTGKLDPKEIGAVVGYLRTLGEAKGEAKSADGGGDAAKLYASKCASCHGKDGAGNPAMAKMFKVDEAALNMIKDETTSKKDEDLAAVVAKGKGKMPAYDGKLSADDIKGVAAYIKTLAKPKGKTDK